MKKIIVLLFFLWMSTPLVNAQENLNIWQGSPVKIDGLSDEWIDNLRYFDSETQLYYGVTNDENNLYLCFFTASQMMQMKMFRTGVKIELKTKTKPKRTAQIIYPKKDTSSFQMRSKPAEGETQAEKPQGQNTGGQGRNMAKHFLDNNPTFTSEGFVSFNGTYPIVNEKGISLAINWDDRKRMAYEIVIPLNELFGEGFSLDEVSNDEIKLKVHIDAMEIPSQLGQRPGGGPQGGGMPQGVNQGQGAGGQSQEDRAFLFQQQTLKHDFLLNKKQ
ncbi:MAG: hypothetical protein AB7S50_08915 [Bacteroidales bacterium]